MDEPGPEPASQAPEVARGNEGCLRSGRARTLNRGPSTGISPRNEEGFPCGGKSGPEPAGPALSCRITAR